MAGLENVELQGDDEGATGEEIEQGGILILSDSDSEVEEEEEEEDEYLTSEERSKRKREKAKKKREKKLQQERDAPPPKIKRFCDNNVHRIKFGTCNYVELVTDKALSEACKGAIIFDGFPSKGLSAAMISKFFIKCMNLPLVGFIKSNMLPVIGRVADSQPSYPLRVYGNSRIVVFTSELPCPSEISPSIVDLLYYYQKQINSPFIFCTESLPQKIEALDVEVPDQESLTQSGLFRFVEELAEVPAGVRPPPKGVVGVVEDDKGKGPAAGSKMTAAKASEYFGSSLHASMSVPVAEVMYITNEQEVSDKLRKMGYLPIKNAVVGNITGCLLAEAPFSDCSVVCLVAKYNPIMSDARASTLLVKLMADVANADWLNDFEVLEHKVDLIEKQIKKSIKEMGKSSKRNAPSSSSYMYT
eukprot:CAMPEP_0201513202 /NCGR_PEP_ID=MMETSP0161_2-20130828/5310_1 /ASSEMBLY_ACC=CAM_ASM_000251 /TAXON_ID=180227 /ORGANISM="Neoparamoeba aestuarina, Strain SoJaBio B1-5/56/2" /LENGTH=415 /DNA_ID=CAMNT_0047909329 /DNA_START=20 /DNA_END=1267 /DNA_ORIENTATION=+